MPTAANGNTLRFPPAARDSAQPTTAIQLDAATAGKLLDIANRILEGTSGGPILLDAETAQRLLGIGESLLRRLTNSGQIPAVRVETRVLYRPEALREWAYSRETRAQKNGGPKA